MKTWWSERQGIFCKCSFAIKSDGVSCDLKLNEVPVWYFFWALSQTPIEGAVTQDRPWQPSDSSRWGDGLWPIP